MAREVVVSPTLVIPASELTWKSVRSGGPGGQHVNKVSTAVELRFDPAASTVLSPAVRQRLTRLAAGRLDAQGAIVITSDETRSQRQNVQLACEKLARLVRMALVVPKRRRPTKPSAASQRRRVEAKRKTGDKKRERRGGWD